MFLLTLNKFYSVLFFGTDDGQIAADIGTVHLVLSNLLEILTPNYQVLHLQVKHGIELKVSPNIARLWRPRASVRPWAVV